MKLTYLASPYTHLLLKVQAERADAAARAAAYLIRYGWGPFSPIAHSHPIGLLLPPECQPFEAWREFDFAMLDACKHMTVLCIDGWRESKGVRAEVVHARRQGFPVAFLEPVGYHGYRLINLDTETTK